MKKVIKQILKLRWGVIFFVVAVVAITVVEIFPTQVGIKGLFEGLLISIFYISFIVVLPACLIGLIISKIIFKRTFKFLRLLLRIILLIFLIFLFWWVMFQIVFDGGAIFILKSIGIEPGVSKLTIHYVGSFRNEELPLQNGWVEVTEPSSIAPGAGDTVTTGLTNLDGEATFILPKGIYDLRILGGEFPNEDYPPLGRWGGFHEVFLYFSRTLKIEMMQGY